MKSSPTIWQGVLPALTTNLKANGALDIPAFQRHCRWMIASGCSGLVCCGSLGEAATLAFDEKLLVAKSAVRAATGKVPVVLGLAALSTAEAVALARAGEKAGCRGLMILPPYVYSTDWREMKAHVAAVLQATRLPCMLYNNPPAYQTDYTPPQIAELAAEHPNLQAVKESSGDTRRVTAIKAILGQRLAILVGMDDAIVEGVRAGAEGWIAGLVNAFPLETVALFNAAVRGDRSNADELYAWFLPLLRLDTVPKFVQHIKWIQAQVGRGREVVRPPRLLLAGDDLAMTSQILKTALNARPELGPHGRSDRPPTLGSGPS